jgi:hypothetical protein
MLAITYPVVKAGGRDITVRFSLLSECLLGTFGITLTNLLPKEASGYKLQRMQLLAASQADTFPDPLKSPGWLKWSQDVTRGEWPAIDAAIDEAIKKALAESSPDQQPAPPQTAA